MAIIKARRGDKVLGQYQMGKKRSLFSGCKATPVKKKPK